MNCKHFFPLIAIFFFLSGVSFSQQPYHPLRITEPITLDGKLNEPAWQQAEVVDDFMQTDPLPGAAPTEKTEVRILYDDEYLYVGFRCYDREPDKLIRLGFERDYPLGEDDGTSFLIDTYDDKFSSVVFAANTLDARWDSQFSDDGSSENDSYNTFWDVATHVDSVGYCTEYRIPFSSLRFEAKDSVIMDFRVARLIKRKDELITYPKCDPSTQNGWCNVSFAKAMVLYNLKSHKPFYITPYAIVNYSEQNVLNSDGTAYEKQSQFLVRKNFVSNEALDKILSNIGVDAKWGLSKNYTLDLTVNTDFAQAEVDDRIINLSKYDVNLPEKRNFFLESERNLSYGFPSGNEIFISRSIGNENGVIVPIIAGARLTGKSNGWQSGILNMQTAGIPEAQISPHNFFVLRTRKDFDALGSFVGGIFTNRINTDSTHTSSQSVGFDAVKRFTQQLTLEGGIVSTLVDFNFNPIAQSTYGHAGIFHSTNQGFNYNTSIDLVGKEFYPVMGYLDESNHGLVSGGFGYQGTAKEKSKAEYWYANTNENYRWVMSSGRQETFYADLFPGITFKSGANINFSLFEYKVDSLYEDWYLDDHNAIAAGTYKMFNNSINLTAPQKSKYSGTLSASYGGFYGGNRFFISPDVSYAFNKHINVGLTYEYNHIAFSKYLNEDTATLYESNLIRLKLAFLLSSTFSIKLYMQYDDLSHSISSNLRIRYNPREGTDLYIVINQGLNTSRDRLDPHLPLIDQQAITLKFQKTFSL